MKEKTMLKQYIEDLTKINITIMSRYNMLILRCANEGSQTLLNLVDRFLTDASNMSPDKQSRLVGYVQRYVIEKGLTTLPMERDLTKPLFDNLYKTYDMFIKTVDVSDRASVEDIPLTMIVAMDSHGNIGYQGKLPWSVKEDMEWFKKHTMGKPIIMGRKTYESLGKPLPGRTNYVVGKTKIPNLPEEVEHFKTLDEAIISAKQECLTNNLEEVMVIGGAKIYKEVELKSDKLYLTMFFKEPLGDTKFNLNLYKWANTEPEVHLVKDRLTNKNMTMWTRVLYERPINLWSKRQ